MQNRSGWQVFAATMILLAGAINLVQGLVGMVRPAFFTGAESELLIFDYALWGALLAAWGAVLIAIGLAVFSGQMWARAIGVVVVAVNALAQLAFLPALPVWSLAVLAVDVLVIYALTAGWPAPERMAMRSAEGRAERAEERRVDQAAYLAGRKDSDEAPVPGDEERGPERPMHHGRHEQTMY
ncbi:DUF7144 family membrane protein [Nocardiopsis coralliicola]